MKFCPSLKSTLSLLSASLAFAPAFAQENEPPAEDRFVPAKVRLLSAPGKEDALAGARVTGSLAGPTQGFVELAPIATAPKPGEWLEVDIAPGPVYMWVKVEAPKDGELHLARLEFFSPSGRLQGTPFGTAVPKEREEHDFHKAFDNNPETWFASSVGGYAGIALPNEARASNVWFQDPPPGAFAEPVAIKAHLWPPGSTAHYTTDGSVPSQESPVFPPTLRVGETTTFSVRTYQQFRAPGPLVTATFRVGVVAAEEPEVRGYHVGNSLTDTLTSHLPMVTSSAGKNYTFLRKSIPGSDIGSNWDSPGQGFGSPDWWANDYNEVFKRGADHLFLQPFPNPGGFSRDAEKGGNFIRLARETNPEIQPWLYTQWHLYPGAPGRYDGFSAGWGWGPEPWFPTQRDPQNWEVAMANRMEYYTGVLDRWNAAETPDPGVEYKPVQLVPAADALVRLKREIEAGNVPGMDSFDRIMFGDGIHLSLPGMYFVSLVVYSCVYAESPEGKVTHANTWLTKEQALVLQRIAWEAVLAEPRAGAAPPQE